MVEAKVCRTDALVFGGLCATNSSKKSYSRLSVYGSSESTWAPFVNVNHLRSVPVKCSARSAQCPPVCSSSHWQAMKVGTFILLTNVTGSSGSATGGLYVEFSLTSAS